MTQTTDHQFNIIYLTKIFIMFEFLKIKESRIQFVMSSLNFELEPFHNNPELFLSFLKPSSLEEKILKPLEIRDYLNFKEYIRPAADRQYLYIVYPLDL